LIEVYRLDSFYLHLKSAEKTSETIRSVFFGDE